MNTTAAANRWLNTFAKWYSVNALMVVIERAQAIAHERERAGAVPCGAGGGGAAGDDAGAGKADGSSVGGVIMTKKRKRPQRRYTAKEWKARESKARAKEKAAKARAKRATVALVLVAGLTLLLVLAMADPALGIGW